MADQLSHVVGRYEHLEGVVMVLAVCVMVELDDVDERHNEGLYIFEFAEQHAELLVSLDQPTRGVLLELDDAFGLVLDLLDQRLLLGHQVGDNRNAEDELGFDSRLGIVELRGLLLDRIGDGGLVFKNLVYDPAGLRDVGVVALNLDGAIGHPVDGLVDYNGGVRLPHDLIDLVALGTDQQRHHTLRHEDDDREGLAAYSLENLINIGQHDPAALVLLLHLLIIDLRESECT